MADFKFVISDPKTKHSYPLVINQDKAIMLLNKKIGDKFDGSILGLNGYELEITGGTDKDGFPMLSSIQGAVKKKIVLSGKPGYKPILKGQRKRKTVRGNTISIDTAQINTKIVKYGSTPLDQVFKKEEKAEG
ncbi:MAG: 30S ribosomal protein S6e [Candidatus Aenigmatarchaeota archaeon]